ncbi:hypothetical protein CTI14_57505, partial [Methylobacterium radiotolerans]
MTLGQEFTAFAVTIREDILRLDVYPTAARLALLFALEDLTAQLEGPRCGLRRQRAGDFASIPKIGRTQLQDAVPMTLGQEFTAFAVTIREDILRL